jgi:nicotinamide mononucleotide (NMN) deamidase PncC
MKQPWIVRMLGPSWKTTVGGAMAAVGAVLATAESGTVRLAGACLAAVGTAWLGISARDKSVSSEQQRHADKDGKGK